MCETTDVTRYFIYSVIAICISAIVKTNFLYLLVNDPKYSRILSFEYFPTSDSYFLYFVFLQHYVIVM